LITSLSAEIAGIEQSVISKRIEDERKRVERYLDYFDFLREEKDLLDSLYRPLREALLGGTETDKKLSFVSRIIANVSAHARNGLDIIDRRRGRYRDETALLARLNQFVSAIQDGAYSRDIIRAEIMSIEESFAWDNEDRHVAPSDQLRKDKTLGDLGHWLYATEYFSVVYSIKFDGKDLQLLSPGQKGIVLLLVYLEIEQEDNRPLVIDQPEDNLDNLSVYSNLIAYFRNRKKRRQIIIITHNPNLVVNTDAEQIIVASFDGDATPKIRYQGGALENAQPTTKDGIRESVCMILEGGTEAFQRREQKYAIDQMPLI
jgi:hypothetical protein